MKTKIFLILNPNPTNMKKLILFLAVLFGFISANAQNPFAEYGYTPKIATLSQGEYNEFFDNDTIVQIGSVLFNTKSKQIVAFVQTDTLYSEATLQPDIVSRWMSPDPLAAKFPSWSPYNFANNSPIYYIDPDGRAVKPVNPDASLVIDEALGSFGVSSETFKDMLLIKPDKNGILRSNLQSNITIHGMDLNEFKKTIAPLLEGEGVTLNKKQWKSAHSLYKTFQTEELYELAVILKPTGSDNTYGNGDFDEGTKLTDRPGNSTNENLYQFNNAFERNPKELDNVTQGNDYGIIPYAPVDPSNRDPSQKGTYVIDATGTKPSEGGEIFKKIANDIQGVE